jgi:lactobin A/cerein 7B family class IIb bacteriocin
MNKTDELKINGFSELSENELQETEGGVAPLVAFAVCFAVLAAAQVIHPYPLGK